ncbi:Similar to Alkaline phosphatase D; acc. no. P42251 [Pyronema omphalodes CBS 100304]|uniref:Similar to Alkaline phosphatase D acc. no. P42251 n=1 Tax=Pyronema omphalodes (strain CBS 100304) TaxID=1076935 RepID=U4LUA7_PYROM|nr:Similar to Alkaline phosphatase D; acc. no. P42251 [Pyronema omphalodes CBS 100304]
MTLLQVLVCALLSTSVSASFSANLNYRSPSLNHPDLGIAVHKVQKRNDPACPFNAEDLKFTHGVASGDPYPESVILWTRISPDDDNSHSNVTVSGLAPLYDHDNEKYVKISKAPVCVEYKVARDEGMKSVVDRGLAWTSSDVDYTVKVEASNLRPYTTYYYQFNVCGSSSVKSPVGRTKTTPRKGDKLHNDVGIAVYSCSNFPQGYFNAYGNAVRKDDVDYVIHLGDYFYEYANGGYGWGNELGRIPLPDKEIVSLYDYRKRYATYRTDLDLLDNHRVFPWISVWDDHEVADNIWKSGSSHMNNTEESFVHDGGISVDQRKAHAVRAHFEWMPLRQVDMDDNLRIWRNFEIGDLLDLIMLDTRVYDRSITDMYWNTDYIHDISNDQGRSLMGARQENWFYKQLINSKNRQAKWRVVGQQIIISGLDLSYGKATKNPNSMDAWDGYLANKNRTFNTIVENKIDNTVFLAGDSHASWVSDLVWEGHGKYDEKTGAGSIGVEFAGTAVSSPGPFANKTEAIATNGSTWLINNNPELQWQEAHYRGYYNLKIGYNKIVADFFGVPDIKTRNGLEIKLATFEVNDGENKLARDPAPGKAWGGALKNGQVEKGVVYDTAKTPKKVQQKEQHGQH